VTGIFTAFTTVEAIFSIFGRSRRSPAPAPRMATSLTQHPQLMSMRSGAKALGKLRRPFHRRDIPAVDLYADRALLLAEKTFFASSCREPADESVRVDKFRVDDVRPHPLADRPERVIPSRPPWRARVSPRAIPMSADFSYLKDTQYGAEIQRAPASEDLTAPPLEDHPIPE